MAFRINVSATLSAIVLLQQVEAAPATVPPGRCALVMDSYCNGPALRRCIDEIRSKSGQTPLVPLFDTNAARAAPAWRCYSPSALFPNRSAYNPDLGSGLFCTEPGLAGVLQECEHPPPPVKLVLLEEAAKSDGAVCLDGSPGAIYLRPGAETRKWHIHWEGGGWCFHDPPGLPEDNDCHYRAYSPIPIESRTPPRYLGSSTMLAANYSTDPPRGLEALDFLSSNPVLNPTMHNYSFAYVHYCDGASFTGDAAEPVRIGGDLVYYRGKRIRDAVIDYLLQNAGMASANEDGIEVTISMCNQVVVSGTSAGGLAVYLNIDQINDKIQQAALTMNDGDYVTVSGSDSVRVRGLASAGYFLDLGLPGGYHDQMLHLAQISNSTSALAPSCLAQAAREGRPRESCFFAEHAAPHITTPTFALQSRFDTWQLEHIPHISTKNVSGVEAYGELIQGRMAPLIAAARSSMTLSTSTQTQSPSVMGDMLAPKHAVWLSPCETHGLGVTNYWTHSSINSTVLYAAFASWFTGKLDDVSRLWLGEKIGSGCDTYTYFR